MKEEEPAHGGEQAPEYIDQPVDNRAVARIGRVYNRGLGAQALGRDEDVVKK